MAKWCIDEIIYLWDEKGLELILNDGEVKGFEKMEVNRNNNRLFYFSYSERAKC